MKLFLQVLVIACFILTSFKKEETTADLKYRTALHGSIDASIEDLGFLCGNWKGSWQGGQVETNWSKPVGDNMMSMYIYVKHNKAVSFQTLFIKQTAKGPMLSIHQFNATHTKNGNDLVSNFLLDTLSDNRAVFVRDDRKSRIIYERLNAETLNAVWIRAKGRRETRIDSCIFSLVSH